MYIEIYLPATAINTAGQRRRPTCPARPLQSNYGNPIWRQRKTSALLSSSSSRKALQVVANMQHMEKWPPTDGRGLLLYSE